MSVVLDEPTLLGQPGEAGEADEADEAVLPPSRPPAAGLPAVDLRLVQLVVESAAVLSDDDPDPARPDAEVDAVFVEQIELVEAIQNTLAALQVGLTRQFARRHVAARLAAGETDPDKLERSVAGRSHWRVAPPPPPPGIRGAHR